MEKKGDTASCLFISEEKTDSLYPVYFGVSCTLIALKLLSQPGMEDARFSETRDKMLQGSAYLLGLLVLGTRREEAKERRYELLRKLEKTETEVAELKKRRSEDAKANEKVMSIFASQEQCWLSERKMLHQKIHVFAKELRVQEMKKEDIISNLNKKVQDIKTRDKTLEEEGGKRKEIEEKLQKAEALVKELEEIRKKESQEHSTELWKHKTAFIELVSNHRQLEAEMGHALRQVEAAKHELDSVSNQKKESVLMVQKLSEEVVKIRKELEQKDKILSAMLRKSNLDTSEKQMLLKEARISKERRKQAELEMERWRALYESRYERHSSRKNFAKEAESRLDMFSGVKGMRPPAEAGSSQIRRALLHPTRNRGNPNTLLLEYLDAEHTKELDCNTPQRTLNAISDGFDQYLSEGFGDIDVKQLGGWVRSETDKNITMLEQMYNIEIDAFAEQLRLKDDKLEASRWRLLSMELESKRLHSHIKELDESLSQLRHENMKIEASLLNREAELKSLKEKFTKLRLQAHHCRKNDWSSSAKDQTTAQKDIWSEVKVIKCKASEEEEPKPALPHEVDTEIEEENPLDDQIQDTNSNVQTLEKEIEVEKKVTMDTSDVGEYCLQTEEAKVVVKSASDGHILIKKDTSPWKMDLHSLGVSYNIKRLNQQLLLLDKLAGMPKSCEERETDDNALLGIKGFVLLMTLLNKQVGRYHSLQEKINDLCKRMHENELDGSSCDSRIARTKEEIKKLEKFLEETFQLQRYIVATGQKLVEIQSRITSGCVTGAQETNPTTSFDVKRFSDSARALFNEVQRGLEVRITRIIGDLEGTLARDGIIHARNKC